LSGDMKKDTYQGFSLNGRFTSEKMSEKSKFFGVIDVINELR